PVGAGVTGGTECGPSAGASDSLAGSALADCEESSAGLPPSGWLVSPFVASPSLSCLLSTLVLVLDGSPPLASSLGGSAGLGASSGPGLPYSPGRCWGDNLRLSDASSVASWAGAWPSAAGLTASGASAGRASRFLMWPGWPNSPSAAGGA